MKRILFSLVFLLSLGWTAYAGNKVDKKEYLYEIESFEGNVPAQQGYCIIKVWNYGKREKITTNSCMENAVHGIIFKGYAGLGKTASDKGKKALVPEGYEAHKAYFDNFFNSGQYLQYVQLTNKGELLAGDVIKMRKGGYKIGMVVMVNYDALRKRLENDKIIKGLDFLF